MPKHTGKELTAGALYDRLLTVRVMGMVEWTACVTGQIVGETIRDRSASQRGCRTQLCQVSQSAETILAHTLLRRVTILQRAKRPFRPWHERVAGTIPSRTDSHQNRRLLR